MLIDTGCPMTPRIYQCGGTPDPAGVVTGLFLPGGDHPLTRAVCLSEMNKEYVTLARAKGNTDMQVLFRHVLPNIRGR